MSTVIWRQSVDFLNNTVIYETLAPVAPDFDIRGGSRVKRTAQRNRRAGQRRKTNG
jgi:hypothetical protein